MFGTSSSRLVLGVDPVVPGQLIGDPSPPMSTGDLKGLVKHLEAAADQPAKPTSNHNTQSKPTYLPATTQNATHCYIKIDNPKGLLQLYDGPYRILDRPSESTIKVRIGTFKSGAENVQFHHWSNAKPAKLREDAVEGTMKPRGRPPKTSTPPTEASGQPKQTSPPTGKVNKPVDAHPSANSTFDGQITGPPNKPAFSRPTRSTRNPHPAYVDAIWLANITSWP